MKVTIHEATSPTVPLYDVRPGQLAVDAKGHLFYRTMTGAACLSMVGESYGSLTGSGHGGNVHPVRVLAAGTVITLEVE